MSISTKNTLQEYFQRRGADLPEYTSKQLDNGNWESVVTIKVNGETLQFKGEQSDRKRQSECNSAGAALKHLSIETQGTVATVVSIQTPTLAPVPRRAIEYPVGHICIPHGEHKRYTYVLVDYENSSKIPEIDEYDKTHTDVTVLRFVSHLHPKASSGEANYIVESSISDAVDHYITFYVGSLCAKIPAESALYILVLSRDHFASALPSFVTGYKNVTIKHCGTERKCIEELRSIH